MHIKTQLTMAIALLCTGWMVAVSAQSSAPTFFGAGSQSTTTVSKSAPPRPSPTQVMSKDDFSKQVKTLNTQNKTQYQQDLNSRLKPMPTSGGTGASTVKPAPAGTVYAPTNTASTPTPTQPSTTPAASPYTGFAPTPAPSSGTQTKSSGWGVTY